jgi:peroxiredoxin
LQKSGGTLLAITADPVDKCKLVHDQHALGYPVLSDESLVAARAFGVVHEKGHGGKDIAIPAHFLIDRDGLIRWQHIAGKVQDRPDPAEVAKRIDEILARPSLDVRSET